MKKTKLGQELIEAMLAALVLELPLEELEEL